MKEQITVSRGQEFSYEIYLREDFADLAQAIDNAGLAGRKVCIVTDTHVAPYYEKAIREAVETISAQTSVFVMEAGEAHKNLDTVQKLYAHLIENHFERKDYLLALGGGVVGDLTGFGAATYLRGVDFIQVPTTLLSQVDSSIGGKTGVDFQQYKNMVGAFHQPKLVYMNLHTLHTLPEVEFSCGMGEVLKTGLIWDKTYYQWLLTHAAAIQKRDLTFLTPMISRCCAIKGEVVEQDPTEQGIRAILNFGHTIGHAVEKLMHFSLLHGQCVGLGMLAAALISRERGMLTREEEEQVKKGCVLYGLPVQAALQDPAAVLMATKSDKKMAGGRVKCILLDGIGHAVVDHTVSDEELLKGIDRIIEGGKKNG